jgi:hypothetical protein
MKVHGAENTDVVSRRHLDRKRYGAADRGAASWEVKGAAPNIRRATVDFDLGQAGVGVGRIGDGQFEMHRVPIQGRLFHVGQDAGAPRPAGDTKPEGAAIAGVVTSPTGRQSLERIVVHVQSQPDLLHVVAARRTAGRLPSHLDGGQEQRDQNPDNGDDDQQFDQREPGTPPEHSLFPPQRMSAPRIVCAGAQGHETSGNVERVTKLTRRGEGHDCAMKRRAYLPPDEARRPVFHE